MKKRTLRDRLKELCHGSFQGKVRVIFESSEFGPLRTEFFRLNSVPLAYIIDHLDCRILHEDYFHNCETPEDYEIQIGITAV